MPISVGNGQQIAPNQPRARRRRAKPGGAEGFTRAIGLDVNSPRPTDPFRAKADEMGRRAARIKAQSPRAQYERSTANSPAARRGAQVQAREQRATQPSLRKTVKLGPSPLQRERRRADRQLSEAVGALPNPTRLVQVPKLQSYSPAQEAFILREQGKRLQKIAREQGVPFSQAGRFVVPEDRELLKLAIRIGRKRARGQRRFERGQRGRYAGAVRRSGRSEREARAHSRRPERAVARPGRPGEIEGPGLLATVLPATVQGDKLSRSLRQLGDVGAAAGTLGMFAPRVAAGLAEATYHDPIGVPAKTAKGAVELAFGSIGALPETTVRLARDPVGGSRDLAGGAVSDFVRRYGPVLEGDQDAFVDRIRREGAAPELADALLVGSVGGAAAGRAAGAAARRGALGRGLRRVADPESNPRPVLRVSGNKVREQELSPNLFRAAGQRLEDRGRRRAQARRAGREGGQRGLPTLGPGEVVSRTLRSQDRLQRIEASRLQSRAFQRMSDAQKREVGDAERGIARLSPKQRRVTFQVLQGLVTPDDPVRARRQLRAMREKIVAARREAGVDELPRVLRRTNDELAAIDFAIRHADKIFTPKLKEWQQREAARSARLEQDDPGVKPLTAEVARARPQGERYGVEHTYTKASEAVERAIRKGKVADPDAARAQLRERYPELEEQYLGEIRALREREGLPEPAFVQHAKRPVPGRADRAIGSGNRAVVGARKREYRLLREGRADQTPEAYTRSLARSTKRAGQWQLVDDQYRAHAIALRDDRVRAALRRRSVNLENLSIEDLRRVLEHEGWDPRDFDFYNPGRLKREFDADAPEELELGGEPARGAREAVEAATVDAERLLAMPRAERAVFLRTRGWRLVPKAAAGEIQSAAQVSGPVGRAIGKVQGVQSRVLLGTNPTWLMMQGASNAMLTGFGVRGKLTDVAKAQLWWRRLPEAQRREIDLYLGQGVFESRTEHIGAASDAALVNGWRAFKQTSFVRRAGALNPLDAVFRIDDAQNKFFKRSVLYSNVKRKAYADMGRDVGRLMQSQERVAGILKLGPRERMRALVEDPAALEQAAQATLDVLGDYSRFTSRERRYLKRGVLFYGFMRYALRTAFYTLPVKHPIAMAITAELANLHNAEVRELLGGDEAPWAYSRIFFEKDGRLSSIDLGRVNPVTSPVTDVVMEGPRAGLGLMSPILQAIVNQGYGTSAFTGKPFTGRGSAAYGSGLNAESRARIFADQLGSTAFPWRVAETITSRGAKVSDDSLPWDPRPVEFKTDAAIERNAAAQRAKGPVRDQVLRQLVPFIPRPDGTRETVRRLREREGLPALPAGGGAAAVEDPRLRLLQQSAPQGGGGDEVERRLRLLRQAAAGGR